MSFLYRAAPAVRTAIRPSPRLFSTSVAQHKSAADSVKDAVKSVDSAVSGAAVKGIDKATELKDKVVSNAPGSAAEAQGEASKLTGEAKGKAAEVSGKVKGKAEEVKGKMS